MKVLRRALSMTSSRFELMPHQLTKHVLMKSPENGYTFILHVCTIRTCTIHQVLYMYYTCRLLYYMCTILCTIHILSMYYTSRLLYIYYMCTI